VEPVGTTLGKTLAVKLSLRDAGGKPGDARTPLTWADNPLSPIHTAYYNCYLENSNC
jgi:hypothetical protein